MAVDGRSDWRVAWRKLKRLGLTIIYLSGETFARLPSLHSWKRPRAISGRAAKRQKGKVCQKNRIQGEVRKGETRQPRKQVSAAFVQTNSKVRTFRRWSKLKKVTKTSKTLTSTRIP